MILVGIYQIIYLRNKKLLLVIKLIGILFEIIFSCYSNWFPNWINFSV